MNEAHDFTDITVLPRTLGLNDEAEGQARERRDLLVFRRNGQLFGVFADEASNVTQSIPLTPLPRSPRSVLGLVCVRGRMLTLLDPFTLVYHKTARQQSAHEALPPHAFVVALRGDEQLALAIDSVEHIREIFVEEIKLLGRAESSGVMLGAVSHESALVTVLKVEELFAAAMSGAERRRRRAKIY